MIIIYAEFLLETINTCHDNPEKSWKTKKNKHAPFGYSLFTHCSFDTTKYKFDYFRGKNFIKNVYLNLRDYLAKIIKYEKKKKKKKRNDTINKWRKKLHHKQKVCYICTKIISTDNDKNYQKVRDHCRYTEKYRGAAHDISNLRYKTP